MLHWLADGLAASSPGRIRFWEFAGAGCVIMLPVIIPPYTYLRDRRRRLRRQRSELAPASHR
jgi:hypothetical protein